MAALQFIEAHDRLLPSAHPDTTKGARTRAGLLRLAREAIQLCRSDRKAGDRASALRFLALAHQLRTTATTLPGGAS